MAMIFYAELTSLRASPFKHKRNFITLQKQQ
jgi:hypothetical protein